MAADGSTVPELEVGFCSTVLEPGTGEIGSWAAAVESCSLAVEYCSLAVEYCTMAVEGPATGICVASYAGGASAYAGGSVVRWDLASIIIATSLRWMRSWILLYRSVRH